MDEKLKKLIHNIIEVEKSQLYSEMKTTEKTRRATIEKQIETVCVTMDNLKKSEI